MNLLVLGGGAGIVLVAVVLSAVAMLQFGPRARLRKRIATLAGPSRRGGAARPDGKTDARRRTHVEDKLKQQETGRRKSPKEKISRDLEEAGLTLSVRNYLIICAVVAVVSALLYSLLGLPRIATPLIAIRAGVGLPKLVLRYLAKRRKKAFTENFADSLDIIVRGIRSGLPLGECLNIIAKESPEPVRTEFRLITDGIRLGMTLNEALQRALTRMPTVEVKFFTIVLTIQQQTGGNLAETLSNLSSILRQRKKMQGKVQALSSEAKSSAMIIGSLPFLITGALLLVQPDYIAMLFNTELGNIMLAGILLWMGLGIAIMKKMVSFEI
jgi:tight adherence protein B